MALYTIRVSSALCPLTRKRVLLNLLGDTCMVHDQLMAVISAFTNICKEMTSSPLIHYLQRHYVSWWEGVDKPGLLMGPSQIMSCVQVESLFPHRRTCDLT